jgi:hypothetical protein
MIGLIGIAAGSSVISIMPAGLGVAGYVLPNAGIFRTANTTSARSTPIFKQRCQL